MATTYNLKLTLLQELLKEELAIYSIKEYDKTKQPRIITTNKNRLDEIKNEKTKLIAILKRIELQSIERETTKQKKLEESINQINPV